MDSLFQRLKELDSDKFHKLCFQLLKERHPSAGIRSVEGDSGDDGVDIFQGDLSTGPTVWQCKAFSNGIRESQKKQIRESFNRVLEKVSPKQWILCLPVDLDIMAERWWERYKKSKSNQVVMGLYPASDIVHELIHRKTIREYFFPHAALDPGELRRLLTRTGELSSEQLQAITENNLDNWIDFLKERDARFNYQIVRSNDLGPAGSSSPPGATMSVHYGGTTINIYPRDLQALTLDPPKMQLRFAGEGVRKAKDLFRTGSLQKFDMGEFEVLASTFPSIKDPGQISNHKLIIGPSPALRARKLYFRLTFGSGEEQVCYNLIEFVVSRQGTEEVELTSVSSDLPFELKLVIPFPTRAKSIGLTLQHRLSGHDIHAVQKLFQAERLLRNGGYFELFDVKRGKMLLVGKDANIPELEQPWLIDLVGRVARIALAFNVDLAFPEYISEQDFCALELLEHFLLNESVEIENLEAAVQKRSQSEDSPSVLVEAGACRIEMNAYEPQPVLFGTAINTGPVAITAPSIEIPDRENVASAWRMAAPGESVRFSITPTAPAIFERLRHNDGVPHSQTGGE